MQLTHGGGFADPNIVQGGRTVAPSSVFNPASLTFPAVMVDSDFARVEEDFANAARVCKACGFDAVELHAGHGYLLSQFICPFTNRRRDAYGGDVAGRLRFPLRVLKAVRAAVGIDFPVIVKHNVHDGFSQGVSFPDVLEAARQFERAGASALVPSGGFVSRNGLFMLRGHVPLLRMAKAMPGWVKRCATFFLGPLFVPTTAFQECFFRAQARQIRDAVNIPVALIGGLTRLSTVEGAVREGFPLVQMARALIRKPDLIVQMRTALVAKGAAKEITAQGKTRISTGMASKGKGNGRGRGQATSKGHVAKANTQVHGHVHDSADVVSACTHCNECVVATLNPALGMECVLRAGDTNADAEAGTDAGMQHLGGAVGACASKGTGTCHDWSW